MQYRIFEYQFFIVRHGLDEVSVPFHNFLHRLHVQSLERSSNDRSVSCCYCVICRLIACHALARTETAYSFVYRLVRPRTAKILAAFSAVDRTNAAKCSRRPKKAAKKVAAWCSQLAACMQPNWLHVCSQTGCIHAASMY